MLQSEPICAIATGCGPAGIAVIRISGEGAITLASSFVHFSSSDKDLNKVKSHTLHFGDFVCQNELIDEVVVSIFKAPHSYTGEDVVEISCHASSYIQQRIIEVLCSNGARLAKPGEFTIRAFVNGKMDLAEAEAVADVIAAENKSTHDLAMKQMRGGFSSMIAQLRDQLVQFSALIELELDFGEEDVEFADRTSLVNLVAQMQREMYQLQASFQMGNAIKNGIPVAIIGSPNAGKSTLLNAILNEEKALVSSIAGTTRDAIEDVWTIKGVKFRFIDTAGLRETQDEIEQAGIERTLAKMREAKVVLYIFDASIFSLEQAQEEVQRLFAPFAEEQKPKLVFIGNKIDQCGSCDRIPDAISEHPVVWISAKNKVNLKKIELILTEEYTSSILESQTILTNTRHLYAIENGLLALSKVMEGLQTGLSGDFVAMDIRQAIRYLNEILGDEIATEEVLGSIFGRFCIGK